MVRRIKDFGNHILCSENDYNDIEKYMNLVYEFEGF